MQIGGPFELVDQHGATRTDADFRGSYLLIYFGFTYCPDTCPTTLLEDDGRARGAGRAGRRPRPERVVPMFISVDPERDTPEALRGYAEHVRSAPGRAHRHAARAGQGSAAPMACFFAKVPTGEPGEYLMDHTSFVYLIGPDGKYVEHFESDVSVDDLVAALQRTVVGPARRQLAADGRRVGEQGARR